MRGRKFAVGTWREAGWSGGTEPAAWLRRLKGKLREKRLVLLECRFEMVGTHFKPQN